MNPAGGDRVETASAPRTTCVLALACALISGGLAWTADRPESHTWQRWEQALTSTRHYGNPYAEVTLRVTYTGPAGRTLRA